MVTASDQPQFNCHFCLRTFARQEHLTRHARAHTLEKPYSCARCDKSFSRQDVLQRHEATHAAGTISYKPVSSRACKECAAGRVRCSKELPCGRCQDKNLECSYPISRTRNARRKIRSTIAPMPYPISPKTRSQDDVGEAGGDDNQDGGDGTSPDRVEANTTTDNDEQALDYSMADWTSDEPASSTFPRINPEWQPCSESFAAAPLLFAAISQAEYTPSNPLMDNDSPEPVVGLSTNWLYDDWDHTVWENQLAGIPHGLGSMTFTLSSEAIAPEPLQSWLPSQHIPAGAHNPARLTIDLADGSSPSVLGSLPDSSTCRLTEGTFYVQSGVSRAPFRGQLLCSNSNGSTTVTEASLTESQESTHGIPQSLDKNESVDWDHYFVSDIVYSNMVQAIGREAATHSFETQATSVPPLGHIRCFVRLYYRHFHPTYPFVRHSASTWQKNNSWILLMAVSATGAKYLGGPWSESMSQSLEVILKQRFDLNQDDDDDNTWIPGRFESSNSVDLVTLQAAILNLICRLHSGCKNRMSHALTQRLNLVEMCRRMKLLSRTSPPVIFGVEYDGDVITTWLQVQAEIRTASMIWILDSIVGYEFDCPHILQLHEINISLSCQEGTWDQPTLEQIASETSITVTVPEALRLLYMEKRQPPNLTEFGSITLIYAICRRTKEAIYQQQTSLSRWTPIAHAGPRIESSPVTDAWPPTSGIIARWRNSACDSLDILHWKANGLAANSGGLEHPTILHLHLSRLYLLTPFGHLQEVVTAASLLLTDRGSNLANSKYSEACGYLRRWANLDHFKARLSMVHAGALLWHIRRYSCNGFIEPHAIYLATLSVWAYGIFTIDRKITTTPQPADTPSQSIGSAYSAALSEGEGVEELKPQFIHLDRPCDDEMVQVYIRLGYKMRGYMQRVGDICSPDAPPKVLEEGIRQLCHERYRDKSWGIESSFVKGLTNLLHATTTQRFG